jgi:peroxiredoxin
MISVGEKFPSVSLKQATADGVSDVNTGELFAGKKAIVFSLPGAFTATC